ncbi:MAG TPA: XRE family transcriptional regulator [Actinomycetes bacterium]|jgi:transcriptional regulator with XRE-family HTH domain|nr:XRE family transcriptional regulator [Actinomycetes bacterium]
MDAREQPEAETTLARVPALDLGARLRAERLRQGMSLREMARRLGMSASALSQIETGKAQPSVSKLFDIVNLLSTSLDGLLAGAAGALEPGADDRARPPEGLGPRGHAALTRPPEAEGFFSFQRSGEHDVLELDSGVQWRRLTEGSLPGVEFLHVTYSPGACSSREGAFMRHAGQEFGYVLSGLLLVEVGFDSYELTPGAAISFPATTPHRLSNPRSEPAHAIWLVLGRHAH